MGKKILTFDGGGIRGVVSITFLQQLEKDTGISFSDNVDLFAGTSTGSIIAGALAAGLNSSEILNLYLKKGKDIFQSDQPPFDKFLDIGVKYSNEGLKAALSDAFYEKGIEPNTLLKDLSKQIVIPTVALDDPSCHRWRMEICSNVIAHESQVSLIDAIMRSTAAPTFFPSYQNCVDGGVAANDPSVVAYAAVQHTEPGTKMKLLSIGTGYTDHNVPKGEAWGPLSWIVHFTPGSDATNTPLLNMLFEVQEQESSQLTKLILGNDTLRLNLKLQQATSLDDVSAVPALIEETKKYIQSNPALWESTCSWVVEAFSGEEQ